MQEEKVDYGSKVCMQFSNCLLVSMEIKHQFLLEMMRSCLLMKIQKVYIQQVILLEMLCMRGIYAISLISY